MDEAQVVAPETATDTPVTTPPETAAPDASGAPETVAETDEEKQQREVAENQRKVAEGRKGLQKRFGELTSTIKQQQKIIENLSSQRQPQEQIKPPQQDGPPKRENYPTYEDYLDARTEYVAERRSQERERKYQEQTQQEQQRRQLESVQQNYARQLQEYEAKNPGFLEAINRDDIEVPEALGQLLPLVPDAPVALKAIADNPAIAQELNRHASNPAALLVMLGKLTASQKTAPQTSKAPPPGKPVGSNAGSSNNPPEDTAAYLEWRKKHMR